jgi:hypothetical protein
MAVYAWTDGNRIIRVLDACQRLDPRQLATARFDLHGMGTLFEHCLFPAMRLLHILGNGAAGGCVTRAPFAAGAPRELSVGLLKCGFFMYPACVGMFASISWTGFRPGIAVPRDEQVAQPVNCTCRHSGDL